MTASCGVFYINLNFSYFHFDILIYFSSRATIAFQAPFSGAIIGVKACFFSFRGIEEVFPLLSRE
jgi:hypothetical protein